MNQIDQDNLDARAGEHVLGLESPAEREQSLARLRSDPAFAAAVDKWATQFAALEGHIQPEVPPQDLWVSIRDQLPAQTGTAEIIDFKAAAQRRIRRWQAIAAGAIAMAATFAGAFVFLPREAQDMASELFIASLNTDEQTQIVTVFDSQTRVLNVTFLAGMDPTGRDLELWVLDPDGPPISLGLADGIARMPKLVPALHAHLLKQDAQIAISLEPIGGAPDGSPTGPVLAVEQLQTL